MIVIKVIVCLFAIVGIYNTVEYVLDWIEWRRRLRLKLSPHQMEELIEEYERLIEKEDGIR